MSFERSHLENYLLSTQKKDSPGIIGPMIGTYEDDAAFRVCGVLSESKGTITRKPAPVSEEYALGYGAWLLQLINDHFPKDGQVSVLELDKEAGWKTIPGWSINDFQQVLEFVERKGMMTIDRHMEPWLLHPKVDVQAAWKSVFRDLI